MKYIYKFKRLQCVLVTFPLLKQNTRYSQGKKEVNLVHSFQYVQSVVKLVSMQKCHDRGPHGGKLLNSRQLTDKRKEQGQDYTLPSHTLLPTSCNHGPPPQGIFSDEHINGLIHSEVY